MHRQAEPDRLHRTVRNTATTAAVILIAVRIANLTSAVTLSTAAAFAVLVAFVACTLVAVWAGYRVRLREVERAAQGREWDAAVARREQRAREDEERSWWAEPVDGDTIAFGPNVVVLTPRRTPDSRVG